MIKEGCLKWINEGEEKLSIFPSKSFHLHFQFYKKSINEETEMFLNFLKKDIIPYFQEKKEHVYIIRYSMVFADFLENSTNV